MSDIGFLLLLLAPILSFALYILGYCCLKLRVKEDLNTCSSVHMKKIHRFVSYINTVFVLYILLFFCYYMYILNLLNRPILLLLLCILYPLFIWFSYIMYRKIDYTQTDLSKYRIRLLSVVCVWVIISVLSIVISVKTCYDYNKNVDYAVIDIDVDRPVE